MRTAVRPGHGRLRRLFASEILTASSWRVVALVAGVLASLVVARIGGPQVKGVASAYAAANSIAFTLLSFDYAQQAIRHCRDTSSLAAAPRLLLRVWAVYVVGGGMALALLLGIGSPGSWILVGAILYAIGAQSGVLANAVAGPTAVAMGAVVQQASMIVLTLIAWRTTGLSDVSVKVVIALSYLAPAPLFWRQVSKRVGLMPTRRARVSLWHLIRGGARWQLSRAAQLLLQKADLLVVFVVLGAAAAGVYSVALSTAMLATTIPSQYAYNALFRAASGASPGQRSDIRGAVFSGVVSAAVLAAVGWPLLAILYGADFEDAYPLLLACLPGTVAYGVVQVRTNQLRLLGGPAELFRMSAIGLVVMALALTVLVPLLGALGAALASSAGATAAACIRPRFKPPAGAAVPVGVGHLDPSEPKPRQSCSEAPCKAQTSDEADRVPVPGGRARPWRRRWG